MLSIISKFLIVSLSVLNLQNVVSQNFGTNSLNLNSLIVLSTPPQPPGGGSAGVVSPLIYQPIRIEEWVPCTGTTCASPYTLAQSWNLPNTTNGGKVACTLPGFPGEGQLSPTFPTLNDVWFLCRDATMNTNISTRPAPNVISHIQENGQWKVYSLDDSFQPGTEVIQVIPTNSSLMSFYMLGGGTPGGKVNKVVLRTDSLAGVFLGGGNITSNINQNIFQLSLYNNSLIGVTNPPAILPPTGSAYSSVVTFHQSQPYTISSTNYSIVSGLSLPDSQDGVAWFTTNSPKALVRINSTGVEIFPLPKLYLTPWSILSGRYEGTNYAVYLGNGTSITRNTLTGLRAGVKYTDVLHAPPGWIYKSVYARISLGTSPSATPSTTPSHTSTPTPSYTATTSPITSASSTGIVSVTGMVSVTETPTVSITPSISIVPSSSFSSTVSITPGSSLSPTISLSPSITQSVTNTPTPTSTPTSTPSISWSSSITQTPTPSPTSTPTSTPSISWSSSITPTPTPTVSLSSSPSLTRTSTNTPTPTPSSTTTVSSSQTPTISITPSQTQNTSGINANNFLGATTAIPPTSSTPFIAAITTLGVVIAIGVLMITTRIRNIRKRNNSLINDYGYSKRYKANRIGKNSTITEVSHNPAIIINGNDSRREVIRQSLSIRKFDVNNDRKNVKQSFPPLNSGV
jgi:hypothetical protein